MKSWNQFLLEKTEHEFSSTQVNLPVAIAKRIRAWGREFIPDSALFPGEGREDEVHVTVLFGLHGNDVDEVREVLRGVGPIKLTLGKSSIFEGEKFDVVKLSVVSADLVQLNKKLRDKCEHTLTHPKYVPHCTVAYVKKGLGRKFVGDDSFDGVEVTVGEVLFSDKFRVKSVVRLGGGA
jgi:2'-5' RNA ligase